MADKKAEAITVAEHEAALATARREYDEASNLRQVQITELTGENATLRQQVTDVEGKLGAQAAAAENAVAAAAAEHQQALQSVVADTNQRLETLSGQFQEKVNQLTTRAQAEIQKRDATIGELSQRVATLQQELGHEQAVVSAQRKVLQLQTDEAGRRELWRLELLGQQAALDAKKKELAVLPPIE